MRVLILHNAYKLRGGEDVVVDQEAALLRRYGHEVQAEFWKNLDIEGGWAKIRTSAGALFNISSYFRTRRLIRYFRPDVVHVHNFFPRLSPSVFYACAASKVPVVLTLHNYRLICPTATLLHEGKITETSLTDGPWWAIRKGVYQNSKMGTLVLALMIWIHQRLNTWGSKVDAFIVLTPFARDIFIRYGLPPGKLHIKANSAPDLGWDRERRPFEFLYVGRLSAEKGVGVLCSAVDAISKTDNRVQLKIVGSGPMRLSIREASQIELLGQLSAEDVRKHLRGAIALVVPSLWYEGLPMVIVEAFSFGVPVIASRIGALQSLVLDRVTGLLFEPGDIGGLAQVLTWATKNPDEMARFGRAARAEYERRYSENVNYLELSSLYESIIAQSSREIR